jgi:hypothetical protein
MKSLRYLLVPFVALAFCVSAFGQQKIEVKSAGQPKVAHLTGAKPSPRSALAKAPRHVNVGDTPSQWLVAGTATMTLQMAGNATYGDCVSAEEGFSKSAYSVMNGQPELLIPDSTVIAWASAHGYLNGANLTDVMTTMQTDGMVTGGTAWCDGGYSAVSWTDSASLCNAMTKGPVKIGIAAGFLQQVVGGSNGWIALNEPQDNNEDHCVGTALGYGPLSFLCQALNVAVPAGADPSQLCYLMYTWQTLGIVNQTTINNTVGEAWLLTPTTVVGVPPVDPPSPTPRPTPTRRGTDTIAALVHQYQDGDEVDKAEVLSIIEKGEAAVKKYQAKHHAVSP